MNSEAKYLELKQQLHLLCDIPPVHLLLAEVAYSQIKIIMSDEAKVNPMSATELYAYELPYFECEAENICNNGDGGKLLKNTLTLLECIFLFLTVNRIGGGNISESPGTKPRGKKRLGPLHAQHSLL